MNHRYKLLLVDDDGDHLEELRSQLERECSEWLQTIVCHNADEAIYALDQNFIHAAIVDLYLIDSDGKISPSEGKRVVDVLTASASSCRCVIATSNAGEPATGPALFALLQDNQKLFDVVDKDQLDDTTIVGFVEELASEWLRAPLPPQPLGWDETIEYFVTRRTDRGLRSQKPVAAISDELFELLRQIFSGVLEIGAGNAERRHAGHVSHAQLSVDPMDGGFSSSLAVRCRPLLEFGVNGAQQWGNTCVVKIGEKAEISEERDRYERIVRHGVPLANRVELLGAASAYQFGAICYSYAGLQSGSARDVEAGLDPVVIPLTVLLAGDYPAGLADSHRTQQPTLPTEKTPSRADRAIGTNNLKEEHENGEVHPSLVAEGSRDENGRQVSSINPEFETSWRTSLELLLGAKGRRWHLVPTPSLKLGNFFLKTYGLEYRSALEQPLKAARLATSINNCQLNEIQMSGTSFAGHELEVWDPTKEKREGTSHSFTIPGPAWFNQVIKPGSKAPCRLIHGDLHSGNILCTDDGNPFLIDYRYSGPGPRGVDFASLLISIRLLHARNVAREARTWPADAAGSDYDKSELTGAVLWEFGKLIANEISLAQSLGGSDKWKGSPPAWWLQSRAVMEYMWDTYDDLERLEWHRTCCFSALRMLTLPEKTLGQTARWRLMAWFSASFLAAGSVV